MAKKTYAKQAPNPAKRTFGQPPEVEDRCPAWRLQSIDLDGPFSCRNVAAETLLWIVQRLGKFESISWEKLHETGSHAIRVDALSSDARRRLTEIRQDDLDEVYSLRMQGKERIFGIRDRRILRILWWDPEHLVCPSIKKHT